MKRFGGSLLITLALTACGDGATGPQAIASGTWTGSTTGMALSFTVNAGATGITDITYTFSGFQCGGTTIVSGSIMTSQSPPWAIANRQFQIVRTSPPTITVSGTFGADGTTVAGTWTWSTCSGSWTGAH